MSVFAIRPALIWLMAMQVAEISRVLKPGGVFVASTILTPSAGIGSIVGDDRIKGLKQVGESMPSQQLKGLHLLMRH